MIKIGGEEKRKENKKKNEEKEEKEEDKKNKDERRRRKRRKKKKRRSRKRRKTVGGRREEGEELDKAQKRQKCYIDRESRKHSDGDKVWALEQTERSELLLYGKGSFDVLTTISINDH
ncbi:hypothetical protein PoB_007017600 [Plakobranchus ocellatus]|uniref:Uncharacterized protein n=1 Tax=Plakobranchus ocellatus TaxID=259542 RepID=A0AAV4DHM7_9GAST|nr:hypothetical protein PoB_007017600 [Plakobranchus ocellatus]